MESPRRIARFTREEFLQERWNYLPGEHVTFTAPTQNGKTTTMFDLLKATDTSWCTIPPVMLVGKPMDPVVANGIEGLGYEEINKWPPRKKWFQEKPPGYALWPKHLMNVEPDVDNAHVSNLMRPALMHTFRAGNTITIADESYYLCVELGLDRLLTRHWTQGAGMGSGLWDGTQKPSGTTAGSIPSFRYNSATHTFLGRDPDKRNRDRFGEIGGVDPKLLSETVMSLAKYEWLYIHRDGPTMAIIEA
jgi:hypothetical protein